MSPAARSFRPIVLTPDFQLRVFISSTLKEMEAERRAVQEAVRALHLAPVMFELGARPHPAQKLYRAYLEQSHLFIGIYGRQYGWVGPGMTMSGLEDEYRRAGDLPKLIYIRAGVQTREPRLTELLNDIKDRGDVSYKSFTSVEELQQLVTSDIVLFLAESVEAARARTESSPPAEVPRPLTPLIGRRQELAETRSLLAVPKVRLLTLTGPAGGGKTRLAIELTEAVKAAFDEVYFVELAALSDPDLVPDAIASIVGVHQAGAQSLQDRLIDHLRDRPALVVLDNFEQVVAAAPLVAKLLGGCPQLSVLVTTRRPLRLRGEHEYPVPPLPVPDAQSPPDPAALSDNAAVALFVERASEVRTDFILTQENATAVANIVRRLDGLPLAIELAAARVRLLSPEAISARLEHSLALLRGGSRDLPERQQNIRDAIGWSYDLLDDVEAGLFRRLAAFVGGWTLDAAEQVCGSDGSESPPMLDLLEALVSQNLIRLHADPTDEGPRFTMLGSIREYALEQLAASGEQDDLLSRHAGFFVQLAETAEPYLTSGQRDRWLARLQTEIDNARAVLTRSLAGEVSTDWGFRLAGASGWFWHLRRHLSEGRNAALALLALPEAAARTRFRARLLFPAGGLAWSQGDYRTAIGALTESAAIFEELGDLGELINARGILAGSLAGVGDYDGARKLCENTADRLRSAGDRWGLAFTLYWLGVAVLAQTRDTHQARPIFEEILELSEEVADPWLRAEALDHLGVVLGMDGDYPAARSNFDQSLHYHEAIGDDWAIARVYTEHGEAALQHSDIANAGELFVKGLRLWQEMSNPLGIAACHGGLARVAAAEGRAAQAAYHFGAAPEPMRAVGWLFLHLDSEAYQASQDVARTLVDDEAWQLAYERGRRSISSLPS